MKPKKTASAFSAGIGYTIGNIFIKCINILTLPLFSRLLSPEEFGVYNVFMSYDAILFVIVGLALHSSIQNANLEFKGKIDEYTSSISLIYLLNTLVMLLGVLLFGDFLSELLGFRQVVLYMLILYSTGTAVLTLYNSRISLDYAYKNYLLAALFNSLGNVVVSLVLILTVFRQQRDLGRILGTALTLVVLAMVLLLSFYRKAKPKFNKQYWAFGLKYSLPIVPHGISQTLLAQCDRIMIRELVSDAAAGIYSLAGNLKLIMTVITTSISTAWTTWFYKQMDGGDRVAIRKRAVQICGLFTILCVGLMALSPELIWILGGEEYDLAKFVAIPMVVDAFVLFVYDIVVSGEYYSKKTVYVMLGTVVAAVLNLILNYVFILKYGFIAAAYTTLASYVFFLLMHVLISRKLTGFCILPIKWLALYSGIIGITAAADLLLIGSLWLRWGLCAMVVIPMALVLLKSMGGLQGMKRKEEENG